MQTANRILRKAFDRLSRGAFARPKCKIAINMKPLASPWGGANQFVGQLSSYLEGRGYSVIYTLEPDVSSILLIDPRPFNTTRFTVADIRKFKNTHSEVTCIHRINECDKRKGTDYVDDLLREANEVADFTIFLSKWLRDYFIEKWFDPHQPHQIIHHGADPAFFHPGKPIDHTKNEKFWVVTHHWSDHWMKGFRVYKEVDTLINEGQLPDFGLMVIGRWPSNLQWLTARTHPPVRGKKLAQLLRENHAYLIASQWEPGGLSFIEGIQCGLPVVYHEDGGGIVEIAQHCGIGFRDNVKEALLKMRDNYQEYRRKALDLAPSGLKMCREYEEVLLGLSNGSVKQS